MSDNGILELGKKLKKGDEKLIKAKLQALSSTPDNGIVFVYDQLDGLDLPPPQPIFGSYIFKEANTLFIGEKGAGKSYLGLQLAYHVTHGLPEFLGEAIHVHGDVLYIDFELGVRVFNSRVKALEKNMPHPLVDTPYKLAKMHPRGFSMNDLVPLIIEKVKKDNLNLVLVVLDNLSYAFMNTDLSKPSVDVKIALLLLKEFCSDIGAGLLTAHHARKHTRASLSSGDLSTGAGSINDLVDHEMIIRKGIEHTRLLIGDKARHSKETTYGTIITNATNEAGDLWYQKIGEFDKKDEAQYLPMQEASTQAKPFEEITEKDKQKIISIYKHQVEGKAIADLAKEFGVSRQTMHKWIGTV